MRKLILILAVILMAGITYGQSIEKGTLIGTHVVTVTLNPGVTMEKYMEVLKTKLIPELEKTYVNCKVHLLKGIRGESNNSFGFLYVFKSAQDRDKYYNANEDYSELGELANAKLQPVTDELEKLGTLTTKFTDWIVQ